MNLQNLFSRHAAARRNATARRNANRSRVLRVEKMEDRCLLAGNPWGMDAPNVIPEALLDANGDYLVSPLDVLIRVNALNGVNRNGVPGGFRVNPMVDPYWYDADGDGYLFPKDVLETVNAINRRGGSFDIRQSRPVTVTVAPEGPAEVFAQVGKSTVMLDTIARADGTVFPHGIEFRGEFENFTGVFLTADIDGDQYPDFEIESRGLWDPGDGARQVAFFDLYGIENTITGHGHVQYQLHGTPVGQPGDVSVFELTWLGAETFPGYGQWVNVEIENVAATVTTIDVVTTVVDDAPEKDFVPGETDVSLGGFGFQIEGTEEPLLFVQDVFVQITGIFPGNDAIWADDAFPEVWLSSEMMGQMGAFWSGGWGDSSFEAVYRFEDFIIGEGIFYEVEVDTSTEIPAGARFQMSVVEEFWPHELVSPGAVGEWHRAVAPPGDLTVTNPGQSASRQLLGGERIGDSVLVTEFTASGGDAPVSQIVIGVTGGSQSVDRVELFKNAETWAFAIANRSGVVTLASGDEAVLYTANIPEDVLMVDDMTSTIVNARPRILSDVMGGISGETPTFFLYDVVGDGTVTMEEVAGPQNEVVMAQITTVVNAMPARAFPVGVDQEFGRFEFVAAVNVNIHNGRNEVGVDGLVVTIAVENGELEDVKMFRTGNPTTKVAGALYDGSGVELVGPFTGTGTVYAVFEGLTASAVDTLINSGEAVSFSLEADFGLPPNPAAPSMLQASFTRFSNRDALFGIHGSHIQWLDDGKAGNFFKWLDLPETAFYGPLLST